MFAKLNKLNCFYFGRLLEFMYLFLSQTKMFIIRKKLFIFFSFSFFSLNLCHESFALIVILLYEVFWKPPVIASRNAHIVDIVFILW
jgi:hypothetical protein